MNARRNGGGPAAGRLPSRLSRGATAWAGAVTIALSAAAAHAQDHVGLRIGFDRHEALADHGRVVRAAGPLGACPLGDDIALSVAIRQGSTTARGDWLKPHPCTGINQDWRLTARTAGARMLGPGQAAGQGTVLITRGSRTVETIHWHTTVTLQPTR